jgi:hypothetical protein
VSRSGRYNHFAKLLNDQGLKVYAMDWIGEFCYCHMLGLRFNLLTAFGDLITIPQIILVISTTSTNYKVHYGLRLQDLQTSTPSVHKRICVKLDSVVRSSN